MYQKIKFGIVFMSILSFFVVSCNNTVDSEQYVNKIGTVDLPNLSNDINSKNSIEADRVDMNKVTLIKPVKADLPKNINVTLPDFGKYTDVQEKKRAFFNFMRPIIQSENQKVLIERGKVLGLLEKVNAGEKLTEDNILYLKKLVKSYRVKGVEDVTSKKAFLKLLLHIDEVPVELGLAQCANESAWGTSYFAKKGNNMFGQWCFTGGCGIVPRGRAKGATHEVAVFDDVAHSVKVYIKNLNSHPAYQLLRTTRYKMRAAKARPTGEAVAIGLQKYSGIGMEYVETLRSMMRVNKDYMGLGDI